jgi:hypothetical protein
MTNRGAKSARTAAPGAPMRSGRPLKQLDALRLPAASRLAWFLDPKRDLVTAVEAGNAGALQGVRG